MKERFKMNRIGFVNFWLYDEEDFEFADGKLLLRGQNASGKSITTQSFIPFILDGDRTPSRLDPFGSSDRKMEYYFLGEEGRDESTGYLFLEFKKEGSEEYRTIAVGQRAKKGKPMDFWGFVILDGRRIGREIRLYREIGSSRIPLDRREMKEALGEENFFTTSQSEYKKAVNQYMFGFRKEEQYEQFIKLLVKVRAPKLSKEFKPTRVYDILNDSLQTLTDEDLRPMVDAMEKMDEIQESLELQKRAFDDAKIIRNEYIRYNQYMLAKKAQAYTAAKQKAEAERREFEEQEQKRREAEEKQEEKSRRLADLEEQGRLRETERAGLLDADLEEIDRKLEMARREREEAAGKINDWENRIREYQERIVQGERSVQEIKDHLEQIRQELTEAGEELGEQQEILQWSQHETAARIIEETAYEDSGEIVKGLDTLKKMLAECKREIYKYEEISRQYDELAAQIERLRKEKAEGEQNAEAAKEEIVRCRDQWITDIYAARDRAVQWKPSGETLLKLEEKIREYQSDADAENAHGLLRADYERQRQGLMDQKHSLEYEKKIRKEELRREEEKLEALENAEELEPERDESTENSRRALEQAGIKAVPFYKAVEFSSELDEADCARLEAQLQKTGMLDALVVSSEDFGNIGRRCPEFLDTVLYAEAPGISGFSKLTVNGELEPAMKASVRRILSNIYEDQEHGRGIYLGEDGSFKQGILAGRAGKTGDAEFVGTLARKRQREQKIRGLKEQISRLTEELSGLETEAAAAEGRIKMLQEEYQELPGFAELNAALAREKEWEYKLQRVCAEFREKEGRERELTDKRNRQYQAVLQICKPFPYGRTKEAYEEAGDALEEYGRIWQEIRQGLLRLKTDQEKLRVEEDRISQSEQMMDDAFLEEWGWKTREKECGIRIRQLEEYLSRPEVAKKASRLKELKKELEEIGREQGALKKELAVLEERLRILRGEEPGRRERLSRKIMAETCLRTYFEEELALKLVFDREGQGISECAKRAAAVLRESDRNKEPTDMLQALNQAYQRYSGSLVNYGPLLEECFGAPAPELSEAEAEAPAGAVRKRVRFVLSWNGKKVSLDEFYRILKQAIDETELLIQQKDRELFEDILSQTISRQLTDRIAESRRWVSDMSRLMQEMDTSMGLIFSLDWKPCRAENDMELDTAELEQILLRDHTLLTIEDIEKVAAHFRSRIRTEKLKLEETGDMINYMDLVRDALDYRRWFEFRMYYRRGEGERKLLTNGAFNRFSGGEKAMAMYVPLFAAVNAQYKKAQKEDHPRIIALDEAFAGVDDKNISSMFELVHKLDFDYIMNSQALWGCFETVKGLRIAELSRPQDSQIVSVIRYTWNGREKILDVQ